jgi:hypothetical protein
VLARLGLLRAKLLAAVGVATLSCGGESVKHESANAAGDTGSGGSGGGAGSAGDATSGGAGAGMGGAMGAGMGGAAGSPRQSNTPCENPQPILGPNGNDTGFVRCENGFTHRRERRTCDSSVPRPDPVPTGLGSGSYCTMDSECTEPLSYCGPDLFQIYPYVRCQKGCLSDADCAEGMICFCNAPMGVCLQTHDCQTDADCAGGLCTMIPRKPICRESNLNGFGCQRLDDQCQTSIECFGNCSPTDDGHRCRWEGQCGARPYLVAGKVRVAPLTRGASGWAMASTPSLVGLSDEHRVALAEHWSRNGLAEHASIASFARFSLELLALGAPVSLVRETSRALADEIAHAELCFGLASAYAGERIEPGKLSHDDALSGASFFDIAKTAIAEGCIGETLAAAEVAEAAERAVDPEVRRALGRIADDEARHAELAWAFFRWALDRTTPDAGGELVAHAARLARAELDALTPARNDDVDERLVERGTLAPATRRAVRRAAIVEVLIPLVHALCESVERSTARGDLRARAPWARA